MQISDEGFKHFSDLKKFKKADAVACLSTKTLTAAVRHTWQSFPKLESYACDGSTFKRRGL